jgi:hypothetical protein
MHHPCGKIATYSKEVFFSPVAGALLKPWENKRKNGRLSIHFRFSLASRNGLFTNTL